MMISTLLPSLFEPEPPLDLDFFAVDPPPPLAPISDARRFVPAPAGVASSAMACCMCGGTAEGMRCGTKCCGAKCDAAATGSGIGLLLRSNFLSCASMRFSRSCSPRLLSSYGDGPTWNGKGATCGAAIGACRGEEWIGAGRVAAFAPLPCGTTDLGLDLCLDLCSFGFACAAFAFCC